MNTIEIRRIGASDVAELQQIGRLTFTETFAEHNSPENLAAYLEESFATAKLTNELKNPESQFYFAFAASILAGYLKINFGAAQTENVDPAALEIERIYVLKEFHGKKVGQALFQKALDVAAETSCSQIWLGVWEKNHKALNFYRKNGFIPFSQHVFRIGDDEQTDFLMKRSL
ncbi:MAG: GNAT family N-acetyltransferase [Prolixibacteraceae bacterium]|nr:GNAT family N-acetyltransferase [Prolixibacteraceae bacterium]